MSRLDSFIRRVSAQRDCLNSAARLVEVIDGPVLELGLGNGRTYDHLRELFPERGIFVFDRRVAAHPACIPDEDHMILGDIFETLPAAMARIGRPAAFAHCDIGTGDTESNARIAAFVGPALAGLLAPGAVIAADQEMAVDGWEALPLPQGIAEGRYFLWRQTG